MSNKIQNLNYANTIVIIITFILFTAALFFKGFTHDLLLEAGVFLISIKLILSTIYIKDRTEILEMKLDDILEFLKNNKE